MTCPRCGYENLAEALRCALCATPLVIVPPAPPVRHQTHMPYQYSAYRPRPQSRRMSGWTIGAIIAAAVGVTICLPIGAVGYAMSRAFGSLGVESSKLMCSANAAQLAQAASMYSLSTGGSLPEPTRWSAALQPYTISSAFRCPAAPETACGYSMNEKLRGPYGMGALRLSSVSAPSETVMFFDSRGGWNTCGLHSDVVGRHSGDAVVASADGHSYWTDPKALTAQYWEPGHAATPGGASWIARGPATGDGCTDYG